MRIGRIAAYLSDFALCWPGVFVSVVVSVLLAGRLGRALQRGPWTGGLLAFSVGLIVSVPLAVVRACYHRVGRFNARDMAGDEALLDTLEQLLGLR